MKTYVLMVSKVFPAYHPKAGQPTDFIRKILVEEKIHTIRGNYPLWKKRIDQVIEGKAIISVRTWSGVPYRSKQVQELLINKQYGPGVEALDLHFFVSTINDRDLTSPEKLAKNDGLDYHDFKEWFAKTDTTNPLAIIHFTNFRYSK